ncbi:MAG: HAMP domain-containing protein [Spirochaetes bacterium]|nr:HAMP domain-containing protein [Spirochaetota bacterium]
MKIRLIEKIESVGGKLITVQAIAIVTMLLALAILAGYQINSRFVRKSTLEMAETNYRIIEMIDAYNIKLKEHAISLAHVLIGYNPSEGKNAFISLKQIDHFTSVTGAVATLFVREGDDFRRVSTSLRKEDGTRAVGTLLDRNHPGYGSVMAGQSYTGTALLFGRNYMTHYSPIKRGDEVTGIYFVGLDFTEGIKNLKQKIKSIRIAKTGYVFIAEGPASSEQGKAIVHPSDKIEGQNMYALKDADGKEFVKQMLTDLHNVIKYRWIDETQGGRVHTKFVSFNYYDQWNWIIASTAAESELVAEGVVLRNFIFAGFFFCSLVILAVLYLAVKIFVSKRLGVLNSIVKDLSEGEGDLTVRLDESANDEIGDIAKGFNHFLDRLEQMIIDVVNSGQELVTEVEKIKGENQNLSRRTSEQAENLEEIAATLEQTTSSIIINAENAQKARQIAEQGAKQADEGNRVAEEAVNSINEISVSSRKVVETLNFIREITFQTNLLALNAAIEAARAGEHGRGFAVVAGEVRDLAQRSADAAREIEEITLNSVKKVEEGIVMVTRTGSELKDIEKSSGDSASLIVEISISTEEQRISMTQINQAVSALDAMTQQNAALVEKTAAASNNMAEQARALLHMLERFRTRRS